MQPGMGARRDRLTVRDRSAAIGLTVAFHILILMALLWLTPGILPFRDKEISLSTFNLPADKSGEQDAAQKNQSQEEKRQAQRQEANPRPTPPVPAEQPVTPPPKVAVPSMIYLSPEEFAASDIGKIKGKRSNGDDNGQDSASVYGPGEGPGGAQLYNAQWYREPTSTELAGYLPASMPRNGYGLIACQTIENFHVDHCQVLGESPLGSGLGRAVRRAAWQFRVIPPHVNGRPQIGTWVRIKIDYIEGVQRLN